MTKGALYFHFQSKEDLAAGVLSEQEPGQGVPPQPTKLQELVDVGMLLAYRLRTDPLVRASVASPSTTRPTVSTGAARSCGGAKANQRFLDAAARRGSCCRT